MTNHFISKKPIEDGGYWNMAVNIIKKHGLMPKLFFPESYSSENSKELNEILNSKASTNTNKYFTQVPLLFKLHLHNYPAIHAQLMTINQIDTLVKILYN